MIQLRLLKTHLQDFQSLCLTHDLPQPIMINGTDYEPYCILGFDETSGTNDFSYNLEIATDTLDPEAQVKRLHTPNLRLYVSDNANVKDFPAVVQANGNAINCHQDTTLAWELIGTIAEQLIALRLMGTSLYKVGILSEFPRPNQDEIETLWKMFNEITLIDDPDPVLDEPFLHFRSGTSRDKVLQWFDIFTDGGVESLSPSCGPFQKNDTFYTDRASQLLLKHNLAPVELVPTIDTSFEATYNALTPKDERSLLKAIQAINGVTDAGLILRQGTTVLIRFHIDFPSLTQLSKAKHINLITRRNGLDVNGNSTFSYKFTINTKNNAVVDCTAEAAEIIGTRIINGWINTQDNPPSIMQFLSERLHQNPTIPYTETAV